MVSKKPIVVVGSINMDFVVSAPRIPGQGETLTGTGFQTHFGGKGANQAVAVAQLGYPVSIIGMVGSDALGSQLQKHLRAMGVSTDAVGVCDGSSGVASIIVSSAGENAIVIAPGANSHVSPTHLDRHKEVIRNAGMVLTQMEIPLETILYLGDLCNRYEVPLMLDPAPAQELAPEVFGKIEWLTPNETEAGFYLGKSSSKVSSEPAESAAQFLARGCRGVVLKMSARGSYLVQTGEAGGYIPALAVDAIDTTAAGDAFNGGFATALMRGATPVESARYASAVAAISVTRAGAQTAMPTAEEVDEFLEGVTVDLNHREDALRRI